MNNNIKKEDTTNQRDEAARKLMEQESEQNGHESGTKVGIMEVIEEAKLRENQAIVEFDQRFEIDQEENCHRAKNFKRQMRKSMYEKKKAIWFLKPKSIFNLVLMFPLILELIVFMTCVSCW